jgi:hypothetical protein
VVGVFLATLAVYALASLLVLAYLEPPAGDQPHYLVTIISLVEDGDADEANNYGADASFSRFSQSSWPADFRGVARRYPPDPTGHRAYSPAQPAAAWYSKHGVGLPLLLAPGWVVGSAATPLLGQLTARGHGGWPGTVLQMNLLGALLAGQVFLLAWDLSRQRWIALAVWVGLAFSLPLFGLSLLLFPEVPAALLLSYAFRRLSLGWAANVPGRLLMVGVCLGYLPWLNSRFLPLSVMLGLYAGVRWWQARRAARPAAGAGGPRLLLLAAPAVALLSLLAGYQVWLSGSALPRVEDHAGFYLPPFADADSGPRTGWQPLLAAVLGLLVDLEVGLLVHSPVFVLVAVGLLALWRLSGERERLTWLALIILPYCVLIAAYRDWPGGFSPAARYLTPIVPLLAVPLAAALVALRQRGGYWVLYGGLAVLGLGLAALSLYGLTARLSGDELTLLGAANGRSGLFDWLGVKTGVDLTQDVPSLATWTYLREARFPWAPLVGTTAILALPLAVAARLLARTQIPTPPVGRPGRSSGCS